MRQILIIAWLILAALISGTLVSVAAAKLAAREIPAIFKGLIGAICGLLGEGFRILLAGGVLRLFMDRLSFSGMAEDLLFFKFHNIPILVGWGFIVGSMAVPTKTVVCPNCQKSISFSIPALKKKSGFSKELKEPCPLCKAVLIFETESFEISSHEVQAGTAHAEAERETTHSEDYTQENEGRVACIKCGAMILPGTAERNSGMCAPCRKKGKK